MNIINRFRHYRTAGFLGAVLGLIAFPAMAIASPSTQVIVTPANTQGWSAVTQSGGATFTYNNDTTAPGSPANGALEMNTPTSASHIQYLHSTDTPLSQITELSYATKQISSPSFAGGDPSYQLPTCLLGVTGTNCGGFTTLVFEPYQGGEGAVVPNTWQQWDIGTNGLFWSSQTVTCSNGKVTGGAGGPAIYTIPELQSMCPNALVFQFGVNVGSNNTGFDVAADLVDFNGTTYNFEPFAAVTSKDACKDGGWQSQVDAHGQPFKNQGDCVSFVASAGQSDQ